MGGADSEISDSTTEVVLEIAWFAPLGIMKTASRHGLIYTHLIFCRRAQDLAPAEWLTFSIFKKDCEPMMRVPTEFE